MEFEKEKSNSIIMTESLSLLTMPEAVSSRVLSLSTDKSINIAPLALSRIKSFNQLLQTNSFTEVIRIFDAELIKNEKVKIASSDMLNGVELYYTLDEYISHLENIQHLMENHQLFHVHLTEEPIEDQYMVYAKEDTGAIISKTSIPPVALAINESNLTAGLWDYLRTLIGEKAYRNPNKKDSSDKLAEYILSLKMGV
jgi:hypothetical protein